MAHPALRRFAIAACFAVAAAALTAYDDPLTPVANQVQQAMHQAAHDTVAIVRDLDRDMASRRSFAV